MKPFAFRLQSLESLRKAERDTRQAEFASALSQQMRLAECRQKLEGQLAAAQQRDRTARSAGQLTIETLIRGQQFEASLRHELDALIQLEAEAATTSARSQEALASAEREVQVLAKLYDRQFADHQLEQNRAETRLLDEVAAGRFQREAR